jgi:hypothetical protein
MIESRVRCTMAEVGLSCAHRCPSVAVHLALRCIGMLMHKTHAVMKVQIQTRLLAGGIVIDIAPH